MNYNDMAHMADQQRKRVMTTAKRVVDCPMGYTREIRDFAAVLLAQEAELEPLREHCILDRSVRERRLREALETVLKRVPVSELTDWGVFNDIDEALKGAGDKPEQTQGSVDSEWLRQRVDDLEAERDKTKERLTHVRGVSRKHLNEAARLREALEQVGRDLESMGNLPEGPIMAMVRAMRKDVDEALKGAGKP